MFNVTFKDVGQGDCIVWDWTDRGRSKVGIIDCHAPGTRNPVIDHLQLKGYEAIEFIILSHPHHDHYSGLRAILEHCNEAQVPIKRFLHTAQHGLDFLKSVVTSKEKERELVSLFRTVHRLCESGIIHKHGFINDDTGSIELTGGVKLSFLAPSTKEYMHFLQSLRDSNLDPKTQPEPNWLSTLTRIETDEWYVFLTSDVLKKALRRVSIRVLRKEGRRLILGQVPHHGSRYSHEKEFWNRRIYYDNTPLAISFGENNRHDHPHDEVLQSLQRLGFKLEGTAPLPPPSAEVKKKRRALNVVSSRATAPPRQGDLVYKLPV